MKIPNSSQLSAYCKPGDVVWGCAYDYNDGNGNSVNRLPTKGILSSCRYEKENKQGNNNGFIGYFIPLKSDGKTLSWKKAVKAYSLVYATTEDECNEMYNELINANIELHKREIAKLRKQLIRPKKK